MHIISINKMKTKNLTITLPEEIGEEIEKAKSNSKSNE